MTSTNLFYAIVAIIVIEYFVERLLGWLNKTRWSNTLPPVLADVYSEVKFENHKGYRRINYVTGNTESLFNLIVLLSFLFLGGFGFVDNIVVSISDNHIVRSLIFFGIIGLGSSILNLPFAVYDTFVIEARFGFNTTTPRTYVLDMVKSLFLSIVIGAPILALLVWFHSVAGSLFWLYALAAVAAFTVFFNLFYTSLILPVFNKLTPLPEGELRDAIGSYASGNGLSLTDIYVMDGSQRSTKANAFFSGWGRRKKIILYDTLIKDLTTAEIVAVLAHEAGHYKLRHTLKGLAASLLQMSIILFLLGLVVNSPLLSQAVGVDEPSFYIGITVFGMLFAPISSVAGLLMNFISRRNEYAADRYAASTSNALSLMSALKKISANSLSNPTPHPLYVFFNYSHPPLLKRLEALENLAEAQNKQ